MKVCIVCNRPAPEGNDRLCERCAEDAAATMAHDSECRCGRCALAAHVKRVEPDGLCYTLPEVQRFFVQPEEPLAAYLARRDGSAR